MSTIKVEEVARYSAPKIGDYIKVLDYQCTKNNSTWPWPRYARMYEIDKLCYLDTQGGWDKLSSVKYEKLLPGTKILITV